MDDQAPNPGSRAAVEQGCRCPRLDNNNGTYPPHPPDGWWIVEGCPLHDPATPRSENATNPGP